MRLIIIKKLKVFLRIKEKVERFYEGATKTKMKRNQSKTAQKENLPY